MADFELFNGTNLEEPDADHRIAMNKPSLAGAFFIRWDNFKNLIRSFTVSKDTDQSISGNKTFTGIVNVQAPTSDNNPVTLKYFNDNAGGNEEIIELNTYDDKPLVGEFDVIYLVLDENILYRWTGTTYAAISGQISYASQAEMELAEPTENTKVVTPLRAWQGFMYWCTTTVFVSLSTTTKTIIGAINELKTSITNILIDLGLKATQNPGVCARCRIYPADIVVDPIAMTVSVVTVRNGQNISASCPLRFFTDGDGVIHKWEFYAPITASFTKINGIWVFYINQTGQVLCDQTQWSDFATVAPIYRFYLNDQLPNSEMIEPVCYEAHTTDTSASDHEWMHAQGTIHVSGFDHVSNQLTLDANGRPTTAPNADGRNTVIALTTGKSSDDGLSHTVTNSTDGAQFSQDLGNTTAASLNATNSALFRIRTNDAVGRLSFLPATRFPFPWNTVNNSPQYITTAGVRTDVTDNRWFVVFVYDFPDSVNGRAVKVVTAPQDFTTYALAVAYQWESIQGAYATMRDKEIRPLYKDIYYCDKSGGGAYPAGCKYAAKCSTTDIRTLNPVQTSAAGGSVLASNVSVIPTTYFTATDQQTFDIDAGARIVKLETDETPASIADTDNVRFKSGTGWYNRTLLEIKNYVKSGLKASEVANDSTKVTGATVKDVFDNAEEAVLATTVQDSDMFAGMRWENIGTGIETYNKYWTAEDMKAYFATSGAVFVATEQELTEAFASEKETMQICATAGITSGSISNIYASNLWITGRKLIFDSGVIIPSSSSSRAVTHVFFDASVTMLGDDIEGACVFVAAAGIWHFTFRHLAQDMPIRFVAAGTSEIHVVCGNTITVDPASTGTYTVTQDSTLDLGQDDVRLDGSNVFNVGAGISANTEVLIKANTGFVTLATLGALGGVIRSSERYSETAIVDATGGYGPFNFANVPSGYDIEAIDVTVDVAGSANFVIRFEAETDVFSAITNSDSASIDVIKHICNDYWFNMFPPYQGQSQRFSNFARNIYGVSRRLQLGFTTTGNPATFTVKTTFRRIP